MLLQNQFAFLVALTASTLALSAQSLAPIHARCVIGISENGSEFSLHESDTDCPSDKHCGMNFSNESMSRFTGFTLADLNNEGAHFTATLAAEAGTFTCIGTVHDHELSGDSLFTPDSAFIDRMGKLGFNGYDSQKLKAYAFLDVDSDFARSLQQAKIQGITIDNLIALRIFKVDPAYAQAFVSMGYEHPMPTSSSASRSRESTPTKSNRFALSATSPRSTNLSRSASSKSHPTSSSVCRTAASRTSP